MATSEQTRQRRLALIQAQNSGTSMQTAERRNILADETGSQQPYQLPQKQSNVDEETRQRRMGIIEQVNDDNWVNTGIDAIVGFAQGRSYDWLDDILQAVGVDELSDAYSIGLQRSPYVTLGSNIAGGIVTDVSLYSRLGAAAGPKGAAVGAVGGAVKGGLRAKKLISTLNNIHKQKNIAKRAAGYSGIGAAHGVVQGAGSADEWGQTRLEGALEGGAYGAGFGALLPFAGAALRHTARAPKAAGSYILNSGPVKAALSKNLIDDTMNIVKNPGATSSGVSTNITELVRRFHEATEKVIQKDYDTLNKAGITVDVSTLRPTVSKLIQKYQGLGRGDVARKLSNVLGKNDVIGFEDAKYIRSKNLWSQLGQDLQKKDLDELYQGLTRQIERGAADKNLDSLWRRVEKDYKEFTSDTKAGLFAAAMRNDGLRSDAIGSALNSTHVISNFKMYDDLLSKLSSKGEEVAARQIRDDIESFAVTELLKNDGKKLQQLANKVNADEALDVIIKDKEMRKMVKEYLPYAGSYQPATTGQRLGQATLRGLSSVSTPQLQGRVVRGGLYAGSAIATGAALGPLGTTIGFAISVFGPEIIGAMVKSKKVQGYMKKLQKAKGPTEEQRLKQQIRAEVLALGIGVAGYAGYIGSQ